MSSLPDFPAAAGAEALSASGCAGVVFNPGCADFDSLAAESEALDAESAPSDALELEVFDSVFNPGWAEAIAPEPVATSSALPVAAARTRARKRLRVTDLVIRLYKGHIQATVRRQTAGSAPRSFRLVGVCKIFPDG